MYDLAGNTSAIGVSNPERCEETLLFQSSFTVLNHAQMNIQEGDESVKRAKYLAAKASELVAAGDSKVPQFDVNVLYDG